MPCPFCTLFSIYFLMPRSAFGVRFVVEAMYGEAASGSKQAIKDAPSWFSAQVTTPPQYASTTSTFHHLHH